MIEHPAPSLIEQLAIGALDDQGVIDHCASCDVCADRLTREARLELALGELHGYRAAQQRKGRRLVVTLAPVLVLAAAAALLFALRRPEPHAEMRPDPSVAPSVAVVPPPPAPEPTPSVVETAALSIPYPAPSAQRAPVAPVASASGAPRPSDTDVVIASLRPRFRACYQENLRAGGPTNGKIILGVELNPDGYVHDVAIDSNTGFTTEMTMCLVEVVRKAKFTGTGKAERLQIPITFVSQ